MNDNALTSFYFLPFFNVFSISIFLDNYFLRYLFCIFRYSFCFLLLSCLQTFPRDSLILRNILISFIIGFIIILHLEELLIFHCLDVFRLFVCLRFSINSFRLFWVNLSVCKLQCCPTIYWNKFSIFFILLVYLVL